MKKTIFTICSIALVCVAIIMSCAKDDNSIKHVGYASQTGYGGGHNPNPNGLPYTTVTTTTTTPPPTTYGSITPSTGGTTSFTTSPTCSSTIWTGTSGTNNLTITFVSVPTPISYIIVPSSPTSGQVTLSYNGTAATSGTVTVAASGATSTASFTGAVFPSYTASGSLTCH
ncbi:MAG: hypothetical protein ACYDCN_01420 [Bacteroidia bacterium]